MDSLGRGRSDEVEPDVSNAEEEAGPEEAVGPSGRLR